MTARVTAVPGQLPRHPTRRRGDPSAASPAPAHEAPTQTQGQAQTQAQAQNQAAAAGAGAAAPQAQAQAASQPGAAAERDRERQVQTAKVGEAGQPYMASARRPSPVLAGAASALAGAMALLAGLAFWRRRQPAAAPQRVNPSRRLPRRSRRRQATGQ